MEVEAEAAAVVVVVVDELAVAATSDVLASVEDERLLPLLANDFFRETPELAEDDLTAVPF